MSYDPHAVLHAIDRHTTATLLLLGATWIFQFVWWGAAIRAAHRDRAYPLPVSCTYLWFAHDINFDARFHTWFHTYDHWFLKAFWVGMVVTAGLEVYFLRLTWKLGRDELLSGHSGRIQASLLVAGLAFVALMFAVAMSVVDDPIFVIAPALTLVFYSPAGTALLLHRRSARGQSAGMWAAYSTMVVLYFTATATIYPAPFHDPAWIALGASAAIWGAAIAVVVHRMTKPSPAPAAANLSARPITAS